MAVRAGSFVMELCDGGSLHAALHGPAAGRRPPLDERLRLVQEVRRPAPRLYLYIRLSVSLSICLSVYLSICLSVCLCVCLSVYLSIYLSIWCRRSVARMARPTPDQSTNLIPIL